MIPGMGVLIIGLGIVALALESVPVAIALFALGAWALS